MKLQWFCVVLCAGDLLPPQVIYTGKTSHCHPNVLFPDGCHIWQSINHWSNQQKMLEYVDSILVPYLTKTRVQQYLSEEQVALLICDVFAAHRCVFLDKLEANHIKVVYIPAGCTGELQLLDISVNQVYKVEIKCQFTHWYAGNIEKGLREGKEVEDVKVDIRLSAIKPIHAKWLVDVHAIMNEKSDLILNGFRKSGIFECLV